METHDSLEGDASLPDDINVLMTELNSAVAREDYAMAATCKKRLDALISKGGEPVRGDWAANGAPTWLNSRLSDLGMRFPTPIQARAWAANDGDDLIVWSPVGSGKTLAFLGPIIGSLTDELEERERKTSLAVQNASLLTPAAAMEALSPALRTSARTAATRLASLAPPRGPPLALILAPSRALALQHANALFSLVGGNLRSAYFPGDKASLFGYVGPKGVRLVAMASDADADRAKKAAVQRDLRTLDDDDDALYDDLMDCDILVADVQTLEAALDALGPRHRLFDASCIRFVAVDEADVCGEQASDVLRRLDVPTTARRYLVGATLSRDSRALKTLLRNGRAISVVEPTGRVRADDRLLVLPDDARSKTSAFELPAGLEHRACAVDDWRSLGVLARIMRRDLADWNATAPVDGSKQPRPRCVVFCRDEKAANQAQKKLRRALWGEHAVAALLPSLGGAPIEAAQSFGRTDLSQANADFVRAAANAGATVLVTAVLAARGLSFANVTHVFILGKPTSRQDYVHMAGRAGRVGQLARGIITTLANDAEIADFNAFFQAEFPSVLLKEASIPDPVLKIPRTIAVGDGSIDFDDSSNEPPEVDVAQQRAFLEDLVLLYEDTTSADTTPLRPRPIEDILPADRPAEVDGDEEQPNGP